MRDPKFFVSAGPLTLSRLAELAEFSVKGSNHDHSIWSGVATLDRAGSEDISFYHNPAYQESLALTKAGAVLIKADQAALLPQGCLALICKDPYRSYAKIASAFVAPSKIDGGFIHPSAIIDPSAVLGEGLSIGALAVVGSGVCLGDGTSLGPHCVIGDNVKVGNDCVLESHVSLSHTLMQDRVHVKAGARLGQGGFGWALGDVETGHQAVPQLGRLIVESDVQIGANTTIDRGAEADTVIGAGSVIDNQVQIAHNVRMGRCCVVAGGVAIAGSTELGDLVAIGGCAALLGHLKVPAGTEIQAYSLLTKSPNAAQALRGVPAQEERLYLREQATLRQLAKRGE